MYHARHIASLEAGEVFACGPALAGTGEALRVAYCALGGSSLYRVNSVALLEHIEAQTLQLIRDQVICTCFRILLGTRYLQFYRPLPKGLQVGNISIPCCIQMQCLHVQFPSGCCTESWFMLLGIFIWS